MTNLPTPALLKHFEKYEQYHQTKGNLVCHWLGIPGVTLSLLGILSYVQLWSAPRIDLGLLIWFLGSLFAFRADRKLSMTYVPFTFLMYLGAREIALPTLVLIQGVSWVFQLFGHFQFEKKSPAFISNISSLLVGPMWTFAKWIGYYHRKSDTENKQPVH